MATLGMSSAQVSGPRSAWRAGLRWQWPYLAAGLAGAAAPDPLGPLLVLIGASGAAAAVHECAHAVAHWRHTPGPSVLRLDAVLGLPLRVVVLGSDHADPEQRPQRTRFVAAMGPLAAGLCGLALWLAFWLTGAVCLALCGAAFSVHLLGLLPGNSDGDCVWKLAPTP
jgi:hypothetical protein